jgi:hypothetical protein
MTREEILDQITERHRMQFLEYPYEVQRVILLYFNPAFYSEKNDLRELFQCFCLWYNVPVSDYPFNQPMTITHSQISSASLKEGTLSEEEQASFYNIQRYLATLPENTRSHFLQQLLINLKV